MLNLFYSCNWFSMFLGKVLCLFYKMLFSVFFFLHPFLPSLSVSLNLVTEVATGGAAHQGHQGDNIDVSLYF